MIEMMGGMASAKKNKLLLVGGGLFLVVLALAGYFLWQTIRLSNNQTAINEEKTARVLQEVGNIYLLPDEKPTVAQIQDKEKIKGQSFFDKVENGDYLIVYQGAKLALLYRESVKKLVNVAPASTGQDTAETKK